MEEINRNTRTLIVSFTVAIMAMIPLRFVEVGNQLEVIDRGSMVLGETSQPAVLPSSDLESPYNEIDGELRVEVVEVVELDDCLTEADAAVMIKEIVNDMSPDYLSEIELVRENICQ
jgi:hypothetical protein